MPISLTYTISHLAYMISLTTLGLNEYMLRSDFVTFIKAYMILEKQNFVNEKFHLGFLFPK